MVIKVLLFENKEIVLQGIKALLSPEIEVIGNMRGDQEADGKIKALKPDILLIDLNASDKNGIKRIRHIKNNFPELKVLVLSNNAYETYLTDLLNIGAEGYILNSTKSEELVFAIKKISGGGIYLDQEFTVNLLARCKTSRLIIETHPINMNLTEREMDVLKLVADGLTNTEIAQHLYTSVRTIETRRKKLLDKTGTSNTATLIKFSVLNGLIK